MAEKASCSAQHGKSLVNFVRTAMAQVLEFFLQKLCRYALSLVFQLCRTAVSVNVCAADAGPERKVHGAVRSVSLVIGGLS
jgi:hypothetical protein